MRLMERVLMGASALILAGAGLTSAGNAATTPITGTTIYGAGASLPAIYMRQAFDCYAMKQHLYFQQSPKTNTPPAVNPLAFQYHGLQCTAYNTTPGVPLLWPVVSDGVTAIRYESAGSGNGIKSIFSYDMPTILGAFGSDWASTAKPSFALSETALDSNDVSIYNNGAGACTAGVPANAGHVGLCIDAPGVVPGAGEYANLVSTHGALIQLPVLIVPVTIAFDPVYEKVRQADSSVKTYSFNIRHTRTITNPDGTTSTVAQLRLDRTAYCRIFNGDITNWNDPYLRSLNGKSMKDPTDPTPDASWSVPLQMVGRFDSSGTSTLFTRHIAKVCSSVTYVNAGVSNNYADASGTMPAALQGPHYIKGSGSNAAPAGETAGKYTLADGSDGVAEYVAFTLNPDVTPGSTLIQGRVGYISPDYVLPASLFTKATTARLLPAALMNASGKWIDPTASAAALAFTGLPPQSNSDGTYNAADASTDRTAPDQWVEAPHTTSYLSDPSGSSAYPIVGTDNMLTYSCHTQSRLNTIKGFLNWYESSDAIVGTQGLLSSAGFAPLPKAWRKAITQTFIAPVAATSGLNLYLHVCS